MLTLVTGAKGFVGRALVRRMEETAYPGELRLLDKADETGDLSDRAVLAAAIDGVTHVIHLASVPGGMAEADPALSRRVNLDLPLDLIEALAGRASPVRFVHASSVAVFGAPLPDAVDDATPARPTMTYGAHKRMAELALADAVRRGDLTGIALRLPGIVARPASSGGFKSAFMSDVFWAVQKSEGYTLPVGENATFWAMSARLCADNLIHAALAPLAGPAAVTLPAPTIRMSELVAAIEKVTGGSAAGIRYQPDEAIEAQFGRYPPLAADAAEALGFRHDGCLGALVRNSLE